MRKAPPIAAVHLQRRRWDIDHDIGRAGGVAPFSAGSGRRRRSSHLPRRSGERAEHRGAFFGDDTTSLLATLRRSSRVSDYQQTALYPSRPGRQLGANLALTPGQGVG